MIPGARDSLGRLYVTIDVALDPAIYVAGIRVRDDGAVACSTGAPEGFVNCMGQQQNGYLCIDNIGSPIAFWNGGIPFTAEGKIKVQVDQIPADTDPFVGGLRVGPLGGLYVVTAPPVIPTGFSNGFSNGFGD